MLLYYSVGKECIMKRVKKPRSKTVGRRMGNARVCYACGDNVYRSDRQIHITELGYFHQACCSCYWRGHEFVFVPVCFALNDVFCLLDTFHYESNHSCFHTIGLLPMFQRTLWEDSQSSEFHTSARCFILPSSLQRIACLNSRENTT